MSESTNYTEAFKAVFAKASTDATFRAVCLRDAAAAASEIGVVLPGGIRFTEGNSESLTVITLPPFGSDPDEIHDEELLSSAAGGMLDGKDPWITHRLYGGPECADGNP